MAPAKILPSLVATAAHRKTGIGRICIFSGPFCLQKQFLGLLSFHLHLARFKHGVSNRQIIRYDIDDRFPRHEFNRRTGSDVGIGNWGIRIKLQPFDLLYLSFIEKQPFSAGKEIDIEAAGVINHGNRHILDDDIIGKHASLRFQHRYGVSRRIDGDIALHPIDSPRLYTHREYGFPLLLPRPSPQLLPWNRS